MSLTTRISHPALTGNKNAATVRFYTEVLGMDLSCNSRCVVRDSLRS